MSFRIYKTDDGRIMPLEYLPCGAINTVVGQTLKVVDGKLALASGGDVPTYLSAYLSEGSLADGTRIPVVRIFEDVIFETDATESMASVTAGTKVQLSSDGCGVTATTGTCAEVVSMEGTEVGDRIFIRFVQ